MHYFAKDSKEIKVLGTQKVITRYHKAIATNLKVEKS